MDLKSNDGVLVREDREKQKQTARRRPGDDGAEVGGMGPPPRTPWSPQKLEEAEGPFPGALGGSTLISDSGLHTWKRIKIFCLKPLTVSSSVTAAQDLTHHLWPLFDMTTDDEAQTHVSLRIFPGQPLPERRCLRESKRTGTWSQCAPSTCWVSSHR